MTYPAVSAVANSASETSIAASRDGSAILQFSPDVSATYVRDEAALWTTMTPRGIPCFTLPLLRDLERASRVIEGYFADAHEPRPLHSVVIRSAVRGVFNVGGDLGYLQRLIVQQDRPRLTEYAKTAIEVAWRNYNGHGLPGVTTIALLEGDALGGGFESALSCDVVIAERHVKAAFPEVLFDMFPGMGGLSFLSRRVNRNVMNELTRTGRPFAAQELFELGVIDAVAETGEGAEAALRLIQARGRQQAGHAAMNAVDRMLRPVSLADLHEVVRIWVDCAMRLSSRGLAWMKRLHQQQQAAFGNRLSVIAAAPLTQAA